MTLKWYARSLMGLRSFAQLCPDIVFAATPPYDGTLCRYYPIPGDLCYKLPDSLTLEDGAMVRSVITSAYQ